MTAEIVLTDMSGHQHQIRLDAADLPLLGSYTWRVRRGGYVVRAYGGKSIFLHRLVLAAQAGQIVDHINGDKLDNRRQNLRLCTIAQNSQNQALRTTNTSGFKGVRRNTTAGKWEALIRYAGRRIYLGLFDDPRVAAHAYNRAAVELHGEFARLNPL
ncbi:HNH endonuclease [Achromobacter ruhlandii]|uniref:HNH endonuclease n=1 Tax=Achromobacter ruhlandii TaxID=72557 RepID=UPI000B275855|nr:HNH endonuclease [Achromobacter ruhlandii]